ncbi:hypothetical protein [Roseiflexus sp.]
MARGGFPKTHSCEGDVPPCGSRDLCRLSVWHHALAQHGVRGSDPRTVPALLRLARPGRAAAPGRIDAGLHRPGGRPSSISDVGGACGDMVSIVALPSQRSNDSTHPHF